jgi:predicted nucleic acid-binding protein
MENEARVFYLDTSAIVKRYVFEKHSDYVVELYDSSLDGEVELSFSLWNVGEALGVFDRYLRRGILTEEAWRAARRNFLGETRRLVSLGVLKVVGITADLLKESWRLIEKHHIYQADALQITSARYVKADILVTADKNLCRVAGEEGLGVKCLA